jgi:hypothetical protein
LVENFFCPEGVDVKNLKSILALCSILVATMLLSACPGEEKEKTSKTPAWSQGNVRATGSYIEHFGEPPTVKEGTCYAQVGYYPLADAPGKLRPFPLFLFNPDKRLELVTEHLLHWGEGWDMGGVLLNPFPPGTQLVSVSREGDLVRVELSPEIAEVDNLQRQVVINVLGLTLVQFEGVSRVMVIAGGELLSDQAEKAFIPDASVVAGPGEPLVLAVTGTWEEGRKDPEEVSIFFDRPITVEEIDLMDERGNPLQGDYYRSVFDMAVVVHPADPAAVTEGMLLKVVWKVSDRLGRKGAGEKTFKLKRLEHP